jgi:uncharacterized protein (DUF111 family)
MGRSVSYLSNALRVNYFNWPTLETGEGEDVEVEYEDGQFVIEDIQQTIISQWPEFEEANRWADREDHIILEGYGVEIALSEYCGLASLSVRVDESKADYCSTDEEYEQCVAAAKKWVDDNWDEATKYWNLYRKIGTFSNGESIYELKK